MPRYACVEQHSEEDCGAACLATVARQYGKRLPLSRIRELVGTGQDGTTLLGLRRGADALGFQARAVRANAQLIEQLEAIPLPAICHWNGKHWVVLHGRRGRQWVIADPAVGVRFLSREQLLQNWTNGVMLLLQPDQERLEEQQEAPRNSFGRFLQQVLPYRGLVLQVLAINAVIGLLALTTPLLMQFLTDDVLVRRDSQLLASLGLGMLLLFVFRALMELIQGQLVSHFSQRLLLATVMQYGHKLLRLPIAWFDSHRSGEVVSRIGDVSRINQIVGQLVISLPSSLFIAVISLMVMLQYSQALTVASLLAFGVASVVGLIYVPSLQQMTRRMIVESADNQGFLVETVRGARVLKTTEALPQAWEEYQSNFGRISNLSWRMQRLGLFSSTTNSLLSNLTTLGLLWYGSSFVIAGQLSIGQLLAFNGFSINVLGFLETLIGFTDEFITAQVVFRRLAEVLDADVEDAGAAQKPAVLLPRGCALSCNHVSFHHPGRVELMDDLCLTIPGGRCTALIGESGCGKSTLVKMLAGLYFPQAGTIHYGPYGLRDLSLECLRQQVALVPQEAEFFNRSILANFRFAYPGMDFEDVVAACQLAMADDFIRDLPDGYQTVLGEFGANLSGGQRQRLAIARALVSDPEVLLLDESTAALDPVMEQRLLDRLLAHRSSRTTLMVSHRPSVISRCDWVVLLRNGRVAFQGVPGEMGKVADLVPYLPAA